MQKMNLDIDLVNKFSISCEQALQDFFCALLVMKVFACNNFDTPANPWTSKKQNYTIFIFLKGLCQDIAYSKHDVSVFPNHACRYKLLGF
jgi:hypothetical protein